MKWPLAPATPELRAKSRRSVHGIDFKPRIAD